eukprot:scaffold9857_cov127-Cylindrotheca_fusiformis.AAC.20
MKYRLLPVPVIDRLNQLLPVPVRDRLNWRTLISTAYLANRRFVLSRCRSFQLLNCFRMAGENNSKNLSNGTTACNESASISSTQSIQTDNPCWGSADQCGLNYLLSKLQKEKVVIFESTNYTIINKPPDLRMDGPYPATVHKLLTYWYPPPSIRTENKDALLKTVSTLHQHNHLKDNALRPCHQLDYATSGVLCVARNYEAASTAGSLWEDRKVSKSYLAVVTGHIQDTDELPVLSMDEVNSTLAKVEEAYRNNRRQSNSKATFPGFMPPHAIFGKWKSVKKSQESSTVSSAKKSMKKRKRSALHESQWTEVWAPVEETVPESAVGVDWKEICKHHVDWKRAFQQAATLHNDFLRGAHEKGNGITASPFPTIFRAGGDIFVFCPLAQASDVFVMNIPPAVAKSYPSMAKFSGMSDDQCFKPSLTKCTVLEKAKYEGSLVTKLQLVPITGRRHQLRVHTALLGHPIFGDVSYGGCLEEKRLPLRMCLHAQFLSLPLLGEAKDFSVSTPDPFPIKEGELFLTAI